MSISEKMDIIGVEHGKAAQAMVLGSGPIDFLLVA